MLVLSRKVGESIKLADDIEITVLAVDHQRVRLGIRAPRHIDVRRSVPEVNVVEVNREAAVLPDPAENASILSKAASAKNKEE
ncbi:MAG: carbon storage regulator [Verrucomicrobiota bacterium]